MALKSTIFKTRLSIANISTGHYKDYALTLAKHPSESDERMMWRLVAFALHADDDLAFGKGVSNDEEPDLWLKTLDGQIDTWIDLGQPDEKRIRQACGKANTVYIYSYQPAATKDWWKGVSHKTRTRPGLHMRQLMIAGQSPLDALVSRGMDISCTIQDDDILLAAEVDGSDVAVNVTVKSYLADSEVS